MQNNIQEIAAHAAETAKKLGANDARVTVNRERYVYLKRSGGQLEQIEESSSMQLSAALFVDGRFSTHNTCDLRPAALEAFLKNAVAMTRYLQPDANRTLPPPELYQGFEGKDLALTDAAYDQVTPDTRMQFVEQLEGVAAVKKDQLNDIEPFWYDTLTEKALVNTNGFAGTQRGHNYAVGISLTAFDKENRKSAYAEFFSTRKRGEIPAVDTLGRKALERVLATLGARPLKTQKLPMIVENRVASRLLYNLLGPMRANTIQQKQSFLEGMQGKQIASTALTLVDDPFIPGGLGSTLFDAEGIPARKRTMIENGVLKEFWTDVYYGKKLGWKPTSGSWTNLTFAPGKSGAEGMMKQAGKGILVLGFLGGNSNSTTGDFSLGINGFYFENGQIVEPVQEMNIAGNNKDFWNQLREVGNDPWLASNMRSPSLLFEDVMFSGV